MSDSESSEEIDVKNEQKVEAKLRDLLEKAKQITPFYDVLQLRFRMILSCLSIKIASIRIKFSLTSLKSLPKIVNKQRLIMMETGFTPRDRVKRRPISLSRLKTNPKERNIIFYRTKQVTHH